MMQTNENVAVQAAAEGTCRMEDYIHVGSTQPWKGYDLQDLFESHEVRLFLLMGAEIITWRHMPEADIIKQLLHLRS